MIMLNTTDKTERFFGKLAFSLFGLAAIVTFALPCAGLALGEDIRGNLAFALIIAAVFVNIGIVLAYGSSLSVCRIAKYAWCFTALLCFILSVYIMSLPDLDASKAADTVLITTMTIVSFPASFISICLIFIYSAILMDSRGSGIIDLLVFWSVFSIAGYLQWFVLIPLIIRKIRSRGENNKN